MQIGLLILLILLILASLLGIVAIFLQFLTHLSAAPFVRMNNEDIDRIKSNIDFKLGGKVYDLGSGDGNVLISIAKDNNIEGVGIEKSFFLRIFAVVKAYLSGVSRKVLFIREDLFKTKISDADYIICYLRSSAMDKLGFKFKKELLPGAVVISYSFPINNLSPYKIDNNGKHSENIYFYRIS